VPLHWLLPSPSKSQAIAEHAARVQIYRSSGSGPPNGPMVMPSAAAGLLACRACHIAAVAAATQTATRATSRFSNFFKVFLEQL